MKRIIASDIHAGNFRLTFFGRLMALLLGSLLVTVASAPAARAANIELPPQAVQAMNAIYNGDPDAGIVMARALEQQQPDDPLGYTIEAEAEWWTIYCAACEIKWGMLDAWKRGKKPEDKSYLALGDKVIQLARARLAKSDTAETHLYVGIGYALQARLYALRDDRRNTVRTGVAARAQFIDALRLDPDMADAEAGLGLYNYYVDTLSPIVKILRFFMGIPGGNKQEGIRQLKVGIDRGVLLRVDARFYLAKNLRTYDRRYADALAIAEPLTVQYPHNAIFQLLAGNLNAELGRNEKASSYFQAALALASSIPDSTCARRIRDLANSFPATLH